MHLYLSFTVVVHDKVISGCIHVGIQKRINFAAACTTVTRVTILFLQCAKSIQSFAKKESIYKQRMNSSISSTLMASGKNLEFGFRVLSYFVLGFLFQFLFLPMLLICIGVSFLFILLPYVPMSRHPSFSYSPNGLHILHFCFFILSTVNSSLK